ncbi:hypothetical protein ACDX78_13570 [Virgibacillus oceani]
MTLTEIGQKMDESVKRARVGFIIKRLNSMGITEKDGDPLKDLEYSKLEEFYISEMCKAAKGYAE